MFQQRFHDSAMMLHQLSYERDIDGMHSIVQKGLRPTCGRATGYTYAGPNDVLASCYTDPTFFANPIQEDGSEQSHNGLLTEVVARCKQPRITDIPLPTFPEHRVSALVESSFKPQFW